MRDIIIETEAMSRFDTAVDEVAAADHGLSGFILAYGQAGRGKSVAAKRYAKERGGTLVHVWQGWSQTAFMQNLLAAIRGGEDMPRHSGTRCKEQIVRELEDDRRPLFVDEADRLRIDRIEDLRDIHELTGVPVVLIGEESIFGLLVVDIPSGQNVARDGVAVEITLIGVPIIREIRLYNRYTYAGSNFDPRIESYALAA